MSPVWRRQILSRAQHEKRRLYVQQLIEAGPSSTQEIAQALGVADSTVRMWKKEVRHHGLTPYGPPQPLVLVVRSRPSS